MTGDLVDLARQLRDEGIERAAQHADRVHGSWADQAYAAFVLYAAANMQFTTEDVRLHVESGGILPKPPDRRAWGSIATRAMRAGVVVRLGYVPGKDPSNHMGPRSLWRAA